MAKNKYDKWLRADGLLVIESWVRDGLSDIEIAKKMCISRSTLSDWKRKFTTLSDILDRNSEAIDISRDIEVENALYRNATGFYYEEEIVVMEKNVAYKDGKRLSETTKPVVKNVKKYKTPETAAQKYWLNNRKPVEWKDKRDSQVQEQKGSKLTLLSSKFTG